MVLILAGCGSSADHLGQPARISAERANESNAHHPAGSSASPERSQPPHDQNGSAAHTQPESPAQGSADATPGPGHSSSSHQGSSAISAPQADLYVTLRTKVLTTLRKHGPARALRALDVAVQREPAAQGVCHAVAHELGHATLAKYHGDAAKALAVRYDVCGGGYTHGVVEIALKNSKNVARDMLRICAPRNDGSCWHGVGHGVMFAMKYKASRAESLCRRAPTTTLVARCAEGVYMQLFTLDEGAAHVAGASFKYPTHKTAARICATAGLADACWYYSPTVWLQEHPEDWAGALRWCDKLGSTTGRGTCTAGVGSRLVKYHPDNPDFGARKCRLADSDVRGRCIAGMGSYWVVHWHGTRSRASLCKAIKARDMARICRAVNG
jgi:hypothetical protein